MKPGRSSGKRPATRSRKRLTRASSSVCRIDSKCDDCLQTPSPFLLCFSFFFTGGFPLSVDLLPRLEHILEQRLRDVLQDAFQELRLVLFAQALGNNTGSKSLHHTLAQSIEGRAVTRASRSVRLSRRKKQRPCSTWSSHRTSKHNPHRKDKQNEPLSKAWRPAKQLCLSLSLFSLPLFSLSLLSLLFLFSLFLSRSPVLSLSRSLSLSLPLSVSPAN